MAQFPAGTLMITLAAVLMLVGFVALLSLVLAAGSSSTPAVVPTTTPADRLRALEALHKQGLITEAEYAARRQAVVEST
jgi:hypothetical protein